MLQPHLRALLFLADDAQEGGGGGPARLSQHLSEARAFQDSARNKRPRAGVVAHEGVGGRLSGQAGLTLMRYPTMEHHLSEEFM